MGSGGADEGPAGHPGMGGSTTSPGAASQHDGIGLEAAGIATGADEEGWRDWLTGWKLLFLANGTLFKM